MCREVEEEKEEEQPEKEEEEEEENPANPFLYLRKRMFPSKKSLPGGESNPGLPRDRRRYSPLYYRGPCISLEEDEWCG